MHEHSRPDQAETQERQIITRAEAKALGLKRYFTGKPCKHGHVAERATYNCACLACGATASAAYRKSNKARHNAKRRARYETDETYRAKALATSKAVRANNEYSRKSSYRWWLANKEKSAATRKAYAAANRAMIAEKRRAYYKANKERLLSHNRKCRAQRTGVEGSHTGADIENITAKQNNKCAMCKANLAITRKHVDHIIPLAKGGTNWPKNLQILCQPCNNRKANKMPEVFARELGMLL